MGRDFPRGVLVLRRDCRDQHEGLGEREIVGDREVDLRHVVSWHKALQPLGRAAGKLHRWLSARQIDDAHVAPEHAVVEPRAERLRTRLFCGEAFRVGSGAIGPALGLHPLRFGEDAVEEAVAIALDCFFDTADIDQVAADADDHRAPSDSVIAVVVAVSADLERQRPWQSN